MTEFNVHQLWPCPIYENDIPVKKEWLDYVHNTEYERTRIENSDISKDRYILKDLPDLKKEIDSHCENFVRKYLHVKNKLNFYMLNSWSNRHQPSDHSQIHYHGNAMLSGTYYVDCNEGSGDISFHRNQLHRNLFPDTFRVEYDNLFEVTADQYKLRVRNGMIILFPSHMEHSISTNISNSNRYSIAFNYFVKGKIGIEEYELEIK